MLRECGIPEDTADWFGTEMFWSHYGKETNLKMMRENGFGILWFRAVEEPIDPRSGHLFVLGEKL